MNFSYAALATLQDANGKNHINGIENFQLRLCLATVNRRGYAKHRLSKFKGIKKENFLLHLKECEFRYNNSKDTKTFYHILLKMTRENPLNLS